MGAALVAVMLLVLGAVLYAKYMNKDDEFTIPDCTDPEGHFWMEPGDRATHCGYCGVTP